MIDSDQFKPFDSDKWDKRYSGGEYVYGKTPNDFLVSVCGNIPGPQVLSLGEGEGRNAVYLASLGMDVLAVDASAEGLRKARRLARDNDVNIRTSVEDLSRFYIEPGKWDAVISIFCHLPPAVREHVHHNAVKGLRRGGVFILEAYTPKQLEYKTGGPPVEELMMDLKSLKKELQGLDFAIGEETERTVREGSLHHGRAAVVRVLAVKR